MSLPQLNRLLYLERPLHTPDGAGSYHESWVELGRLWCDVDAGTGRDGAQDAASISGVSYRIIVRAAPVGDPRRPVAGQRFRDGERLFRIRAVGERDGHGAFLTCFTEEEVVI